MTGLLIDVYSLFFRAFHALPPMHASDGTPTSAVYGFAAFVIKLLREWSPSGVAFAIDAPGPTERARVFPAYKQTRLAMPNEAGAQLPILRSSIAALGFPAFSVRGFEADDVLATLARLSSSRGEETLIVSGDRDLFQVARGRTAVLFVGRRGGVPERYDQAAVQARFGVAPEQLPTYVALVGDPSDNLPKVPGIGPRTAARLVSEHGSASALLGALQSVPSARLREALRAHAGQVLRTEALARLRDDLDLGPGPYAAPLSCTAIESTRALFARLEFHSLLPRLEALRPQAR